MPSSPVLFTCYRVLSRSYFHLTVLFVFLYDRGLSLPTVELTLAVYGAALAVSGRLTKPLAARLSLTGSVAAGEWLKALGLVLLALPGGLPVALLGQLVAALGFSLASGTDSALLAEVCERDGADARAWESRSGSLTFAAALVAGVLGALLYQVSHTAPFYLSAAMSALAALTAPLVGRGLTGPKGRPSGASRPTAGTGAARTGAAGAPAPGAPAPGVTAPGAIAPGTPAPLPAAVLRWSAYYTVVRAFVLALFIGFLPYLLYLRLHVSLPVFGLVLGSYTLSGYFTARYGRRAVDRFGARPTATASAALAGLGLLILLWQPNTAGAAVATLALGAGVGAVRPVAVGAIGELLADRPAAERAAALRANESRFAAVNTVLVLLAGVLLDRLGFEQLLLGIVLGYLVLATAVVLALPRAAAPEPQAVPA